MMVLLDRSFDTVSANTVVLCANMSVFYCILFYCVPIVQCCTRTRGMHVVHALMVCATFLLLEKNAVFL